MRYFIYLIAAVLAGSSMAFPTFGEDVDQKLSDAEFVRKASAAGLAEVNAAQIALKQAKSDEVKKFARQMIEDHTKANAQLNSLADSKRYMPAATMDNEHQKMARKMADLTGRAFDREYIQTQLKDHEKAVALFEHESKDGKDADLKEFASKTLPTLKKHLEMVRMLAGQEKEKGTATNK